MPIPITISIENRKLISQAVHETIIHFQDKYKLPSEEVRCFYYAGLTTQLCNYVLRTCLAQDKNPDYSLYSYCMECGSISIRTTSDPNDNSQGINFGAFGNTTQQGEFHCWVVGVYKLYNQIYKRIEPSEFIDLTSRFYSINAQKQDGTWQRDDIHDYVWLPENELDELGISPWIDEKASIEFSNSWLYFDEYEKFFNYSKDRYFELKNLI